MLAVKQLNYRYDDFVVDFDFTAKSGEITAILGSSGAGKSTLLGLLSGFIAPDSGKIEVSNRELSTLAPHKRPLSILFQEHNIFPHLTVFENIALGISPTLKLTEPQCELVKQAAESVSIEQYISRLPEQLSGGQKQRIALARAILRQRPLLLLDEPFSALDPALRNEMLSLVRQLAQQQKMVVLMVTHSPDDALKVASHCLLIDNGKIAMEGKPEDLLNDQDNQFIRRYLG
ncbi:thiamine ABC transporter ATP-binding protein [Vibrio sp. SS-MA-C1-2]|uniref:thiamine ABC transporter ATP-binding protein n=1 Tax=Vibrio sp. SS-MA-C1-2 TaxID=2908646 RepID=UPI001F44D6EC|nr:thiamine ABC transporter ATP-binding protein [Vibrio sp. SS-MA-C1-2]UJF19144.1 thiamine ABC transporter ATP-binding protein [Vibrio sp. SS-MA-C1-2]